MMHLCRLQDFLFQQIAERDQQKRLLQEQKGGLKVAAQAAAEEHRVTETHQMRERKKRYLQYRLDLEGQMRTKQTTQHTLEDPRGKGGGASSVTFEEQMSGAEKAINRRYVFEACMLSGSVVACNARRVHGDTPGTAEDFGPRGIASAMHG
eukprot:s6249_g3.t1